MGVWPTLGAAPAGRIILFGRKGGHAEGAAGALQALLEGWHGRAALWIVAAGLLSLVVYRLAHVVRARSAIEKVGPLASIARNSSMYPYGSGERTDSAFWPPPPRTFLGTGL